MSTKMPFETFPPPFPPVDAQLVDKIVSKLKSQGIFDQFRKDCLADVDTKPAYQNLQQRVNGTVATFLATQTWQQDLNKTQLRESLRRHVQQGFLEVGVDRIVDQVVNPKIIPVFMPKVEDVVYDCLGIEKPKNLPPTTISASYIATAPPLPKTSPPPIKNSLIDLLPKDLDPVSPESDNLSMTDGTPTKDERNNNESTPKYDQEDSQLSGISELSSHMGDSFRENPADSNTLKSISSPKGAQSDFQFDNFTNLSEKIRQAEMSHGQVTDPNFDIKKEDADSTTGDALPIGNHDSLQKSLKQENNIDEAKLESMSNNSLSTFEDSKNFITNKFVRDETFTSFSEDSITSTGFTNKPVMNNIPKPSECSENSNNSHSKLNVEQDEKPSLVKEQTIEKESNDSQTASEISTKTDVKCTEENKDSRKGDDKDRKERDSSASSKMSRSSDRHKNSDSKHRSSHDKKDERDKKDESKVNKEKGSQKDEKERSRDDKDRSRNKDDKYSSKDKYRDKDKTSDKSKSAESSSKKYSKSESKDNSDKDKKTDKDHSDKDKSSKDKYEKDKDKSSRSKHDRDKDRNDKEKRERDRSEREKEKKDKDKHEKEKTKLDKDKDGQNKDREKEKDKSRHDKEKHERTKHDKDTKHDKERSRNSDDRDKKEDRKKDSKRSEKSSHSSSKGDERENKLKTSESSSSSRHKQNGERSKTEDEKRDRKRKGERCNDEIKSKEARRSSDRDSSGGKGGSSHKASSSENRLATTRETTGHSEKKTKSSNVEETTDSQELYVQPSDDIDGPSGVEKIITQLNSSIKESQNADSEKELVIDDVPVKKPKIAKNIFEIRKIMQARKNIDRKFKHELKNRKEGPEVPSNCHEAEVPSPQPIKDVNIPEENKENIKAHAMERKRVLKPPKFLGFQQNEIDKSCSNFIRHRKKINFIINSNEKNSSLEMGTSGMELSKNSSLDDNEEFLDNNLNNLRPKLKSLEKSETMHSTERETASIENMVNGKVDCFVVLSRNDCSETALKGASYQSPEKSSKRCSPKRLRTNSKQASEEKSGRVEDVGSPEQVLEERLMKVEPSESAQHKEQSGGSKLGKPPSPARVSPQIKQPTDSPIKNDYNIAAIDEEALLDNLFNTLGMPIDEYPSDDSDYETRIKSTAVAIEVKEVPSSPVPEPIQTSVATALVQDYVYKHRSEIDQNSQPNNDILKGRVVGTESEKSVEVLYSNTTKKKSQGTPKEGSEEKMARRNQRLSRSSQRYESTDLYKPRPVLPQNSKRIRTSRSVLSEESQRMKRDQSDSHGKRRGR